MPQSIAIIGASRNRDKYGNKALRAYMSQGYTVYPVHPRADSIEGVPAYASVLDIPESVPEATLYVPPEIGLAIVPDLAAKRVERVWVNPGAESPELLDAIADHGMEAIVACSILGVGVSPASL